MADDDSRVTIHMAASLDGFIARKDGSVDWLETSDEFAGGETMTPEFVEAFLETIDCYVMGSRTYETALSFEAGGFGWAYGDKPVFVLTNRDLPRSRHTVEFHSGDLAGFVNGRLRPAFRSIWFVGGGAVSGECLRLGLADEVRYSILPVLIGEGISFFDRIDGDVALHLAEVKAYVSGMAELRYEVRAQAAPRAARSSPRADPEAVSGTLTSINPFFIVKNLSASIAWYVDRLGFQLDFQGPDDDPYYGRVSRDGVGIMLKAILPDVVPRPNRTRHEWARWDAFIHTPGPDELFDEFRQRGATFVTELSFIDDALWGFEVADADGYVIAFARARG